MKLIPDTNDLQVFDNGVIYVQAHFVTVPLTHFRTYDEITSLSQLYNVVNINKLHGLINLMFQNKNDAEAFAKKVNER